MESPGSTNPHNIRKAKFLFELLCKTPVPAPLEEFDKFWRGHAYSVQALLCRQCRAETPVNADLLRLLLALKAED
ncbi:hypothetical protein ACLB2K_062235 [Fragaria x ananassa]